MAEVLLVKRALKSGSEAVAHLMMINFSEWHAAVCRGEQIIGRGTEAQICVPDRFRSVSRKHACVSADGRDRIWISDLRSRRGTSLNGVSLKPERRTQVVIGDRILLGALELTLVDQPRMTAEIAATAVCDVEETDRRSVAASCSSACSTEFLKDLTPAEMEVVHWMSRGFTDLQTIGGKLHRSPHTVRTQLGSIFLKTGVHCRDELVGRLRRASAGERSVG